MDSLTKVAILLVLFSAGVMSSSSRKAKVLDLNSKGLTESSRNPKFLNLFTIYRFPNNPCAISGSTKTGVCLTAAQCAEKNGTNTGTCAQTYGVCCLVTINKCGDESRDNITNWVNPGGASGYNMAQTCSLRVTKTNSNICQFRVNFIKFTIQPPTDGNCNNDRFTISGQDTNNILPVLCGTNNGQHIYVNVGSSQGPIIFNMITSGSFSRMWDIQISQIECASQSKAPDGCLQYFVGAAGVIESFNYADPASTHLNNLEYSICYRKELGFCSYTLQQVDLTANLFAIDGGTANNAGTGDVDCPNDFLIVHNLRLCGDRFNDGTTGVASTASAPVTDSTTGPFTTVFKSDGTIARRGFQLNFRQNPCGFVGK